MPLLGGSSKSKPDPKPDGFDCEYQTFLAPQVFLCEKQTFLGIIMRQENYHGPIDLVYFIALRVVQGCYGQLKM